MDEDQIRKALEKSLGEEPWVWLKNQAALDTWILVSQSLDLLETGIRIAKDDKATVGKWISSESITRPSQAQFDEWDGSPNLRFRFLVVSPFVLIQLVEPKPEIVFH